MPSMLLSAPYIDGDGKTDAEKYLTAINDGSIVACSHMRRLSDIMLPRFSGEYHGFHYDPDRATRPVRWIEKFCCFPEGEKMGQPFILEQYERMAIELGFGFVNENNYRQMRQVLMMLARKNGKALSLDTEIPTPDGWKLMHDIHVGDLVFGQDGKPSTVIAESEIFDKPMYIVTFEDGSTVKASGDHIWTVQTKKSRRCAKDYLPGKTNQTKNRKFRKGGWFEVTTQQMADDSAFVHHRADGKGVEYKYRVPMSLPVEYPAKDLPIDPYVFGAWLGDGTSSKPQITIGREDEDEMVANLSLRGHVITEAKYPSNRCPLYDIDHHVSDGKIGPFKKKLRDLGVLGNKHIPDVYMTASVMQRWELLRGLMDTDGTCSKAGQCEFTQKSKVIAEQLVELCASLGIKATMHSKHATCNGVPAGIVYRVQFYTDKAHSCFHLKRKHNRLKNHLAPRMSCKSIVGIEPIPNEPSKCIAIDNDSHLYLAGRQYTATHNTSLLAAIMLYMLTSDMPIELGAEVYCCATSEAQARKCFGAADAMRIKSPALSKRLRRGKVQKRGASGLNYDKTGSFLIPLAASLGLLDGLSASGVVYDELAAATDNGALLDLLEESMSARRQAMTWIISTENYVRQNIWDERIEYSIGWLKGEIHDDTFLPILYKLDSESEIDDEAMWPKANPGLLCGVKDWQYLRDRVNRAKQSPRSRPSLLIKEFNLRANSAESFLTHEECHNPETFTFNPKTDRYGVVGFDLAKGTGDLIAAVCMFMRPGDDRIYEIPHFWIAEEAIRINGAKDFKERDAVPYHLWAQQETCGFKTLTIVSGDRVNQKVIVDWIQELADMGMYTRYVGYDSWHVDDWTQRMLGELVGKSNFEEVPQTAKALSPMMIEHQVDLRAHRIINPCPTTEWCRSNVMSKPQDANGNYFPQKKDLKPNKKIDGYMAELFAYKMLKAHWDEYLQIIGWDEQA